LNPTFLATAVEAALAAGRLQRRHFRSDFSISKKGAIDLVTEIDVAVEREFRALIAERFPDHEVLGEEGGSGALGDQRAPQTLVGPSELELGRRRRHRWIIDPIDGTTNYAHGLALFCVSIALEVDGELVLGVVYDPMADELFTAERGQGARLNGRRIHVTETAELIDALLCTGFPYTVREKPGHLIEGFAAFMRQARAVRRLGSAALDLCYTAAGRFDAFYEEKLQAWDIAAGVVVVLEAGGRVTGTRGEPFDAHAGHVVASNGHLHAAVLSTLDTVRRNHPE
jgi:myo-inositol-1(or 4)-monophosphatase